jgi:hypothetical protein
MRKALWIIGLLVCIASGLYAQDTIQLDTADVVQQKPTQLPQTVSYTAGKTGTIGIVLDFDASILPSFIRLTTLIEQDTLYDYIRIDRPGKSILKTLIVEPDQRVIATVELFQEVDTSTYRHRALLRMDDKVVSITAQNQRFAEPEGDLLYSDDVILLRYVKKEFGEEHLVLVAGITPGFPYSELLTSVKVVTQRDGVLEEEVAIPVEWGKSDPWLPVRLRKKSGIKLKNPGTYFIRIQSLHEDQRLNGVDYLSFESIKMK